MTLSMKNVASGFALVLLSFFLSLPFASADEPVDRSDQESVEITAAALVALCRDFYQKTEQYDYDNDALHDLRMTVQTIGDRSYELFNALQNGESDDDVEAIFVDILTLKDIFSQQVIDAEALFLSTELPEIRYLVYTHEAIADKIHALTVNLSEGLSLTPEPKNYEFKGRFEYVDEKGDDHHNTVTFSGASRQTLYDSCMRRPYVAIYSVTIQYRPGHSRPFFPSGISLWSKEQACAIAALNAKLLEGTLSDANFLSKGKSDTGAPFYILEHSQTKLRSSLQTLAPKLFDLSGSLSITLNGRDYISPHNLNREQLSSLLLFNVSHPKTERDEGREKYT